MRILPSDRPLPNVALLFMAATLLIGGLTGCQPTPEPKRETSSNVSPIQPTVSESSLSTTLSPTANMPTIAINTPANTTTDTGRVADSGKQIAEQLEISYAREAANTNNQCPKLVDFQLTNQAIARNNEQLAKDSCDYLVYLNAGDKLQVTVNNNLQAQLITPTYFDFSQGAYIAPQFDKYTIRIRYNGSRFQPQNLTYNVILTRNNIAK